MKNIDFTLQVNVVQERLGQTEKQSKSVLTN
jgi:hypothetical protein